METNNKHLAGFSDFEITRFRSEIEAFQRIGETIRLGCKRLRLMVGSEGTIDWDLDGAIIELDLFNGHMEQILKMLTEKTND